MFSLVETVRKHAQERPDKQALIFDDRSFTYGELNAETSKVANALERAGIGYGDRVAFVAKNIPEFYLFTFGAAKVGAVSVGVNWRLAPPEMDYVLEHAEVQLVVFDSEFFDHLAALRLARSPRVITIGGDGTHREFTDWVADASDVAPGFSPQLDDTAVQVYTSGTTGLPKGAEISNRNLDAVMGPYTSITGLNADSVIIQALPMFHIGGSVGVFLGLWCGSTNVVHREVNPLQMLVDVPKYGVTNLMLVPAILQMFPSLPGASETDFSSVQLVNYGASPISEEVLRASMDLFGCPLLQTYGLTEATACITYLPPEDHDPGGPRAKLMRSAGKPVPGVEVRIVGTDGRDVAEGEIGEIWTRSHQNMKGYWNNPEATAAAYPEGRDADGLGWLATGDAGAMEDGYVFIKDRVKDMIISGGENIYPAEIENALMSHPGVADAAVIGIPSERWGESPLAIVVPVDGENPSAADIIGFCAERIARYKLPVRVERAEEIPRNASGKILKVELRDRYRDPG